MKRVITLILALMAMSVLAAPVAANPRDDDGPMNKAKCEAQGGFWSNNKGEKSCNTIEEVPFDRPDTGEDVPQVVRDFWAGIDDDEIIGFLVLVSETHTQRGNVNPRARGTVDSYQYFLTCETSPLGPIIPAEVCRLLAKGPVL